MVFDMILLLCYFDTFDRNGMYSPTTTKEISISLCVLESLTEGKSE